MLTPTKSFLVGDQGDHQWLRLRRSYGPRHRSDDHRPCVYIRLLCRHVVFLVGATLPWCHGCFMFTCNLGASKRLEFGSRTQTSPAVFLCTSMCTVYNSMILKSLGWHGWCCRKVQVQRGQHMRKLQCNVRPLWHQLPNLPRETAAPKVFSFELLFLPNLKLMWNRVNPSDHLEKVEIYLLLVTKIT